MTVTGTAAGTRPASELSPGCAGFVADEPDYLLNVEGTEEGWRGFIRVYTRSEGDLVLVIQKPDGSFVCEDDDSETGLNPNIVFGSLETNIAGTYRVWVGVFEEGDTSDYTLLFEDFPTA